MLRRSPPRAPRPRSFRAPRRRVKSRAACPAFCRLRRDARRQHRGVRAVLSRASERVAGACAWHDGKMQESILVTGGAGFVGAHIVVELAQAGYVPVVLDDY